VGITLTAEITEVNRCKKNLTVEAPSQEFEKEIEKIAREYARTAKIPGFRPGKAPTSVIRQRFGNDLIQEATREIIDRYWQDAISANNLKPLNQPELENLENNPGNPLKFTLSFEELPPLEVKDYQGVEIKQASAEVTDDDLNKAIEDIRKRYAQFVPVEGEAKDGHYLIANISGLRDGESEPFHDDDTNLIVGQPQMDPAFSENLRGMKPGETKSFEIPLSKDGQEATAKKIRYTVTVKEIKERQLPELTDEFTQDLGEENLEAFRAKVREDLVTQARQRAEKETREALLDAIIARQPIEVPECMVKSVLGGYTRNLVDSLAYQGVDESQASRLDWKKIIENEQPRAEQVVRRMIFLDAIADQENLAVTDEEMESELQQMAAGARLSVDALKAQFEKEKRLDSLRMQLRQNKALDFIYRNANIRVE